MNAKKALVINEGRGQAGLAAAELLLHKGIEVEILTSDIAVAADLDPTNRTAWYTRLGAKNCCFTSNQVIDSASSQTVKFKNIFDDRTELRNDIDLIVDWPGTRVTNDLCNDLKVNSRLYSIGDCVTPRTIEIAMSEALNVAREI